jgi:hypothetical protein
VSLSWQLFNSRWSEWTMIYYYSLSWKPSTYCHPNSSNFNLLESNMVHIFQIISSSHWTSFARNIKWNETGVLGICILDLQEWKVFLFHT